MSQAPKFEPTKLIWVDFEMTGLDSSKDLILEVAVEITDMQLQTLDSYEARIKQSKPAVLDRMNQNLWWRDYPENRDDFINKLDQGKPLAQVEADLLKLVEQHFSTNDPVVLAGNSIYNDRLFIKSYLPNLELKLHYRMLDVTSFKIFMQGRYQVYFEKPESHRAFEDIQASIAELQYYTEFFKNDSQAS